MFLRNTCHQKCRKRLHLLFLNPPNVRIGALTAALSHPFECDIMFSGRSLLTFRRNIVPPSSSLRKNPRNRGDFPLGVIFYHGKVIYEATQQANRDLHFLVCPGYLPLPNAFIPVLLRLSVCLNCVYVSWQHNWGESSYGLRHSKQLISVTTAHATEERCFLCGTRR
jgi:hypothetical protein